MNQHTNKTFQLHYACPHEELYGGETHNSWFTNTSYMHFQQKKKKQKKKPHNTRAPSTHVYQIVN
jgi:hypothetical protein